MNSILPPNKTPAEAPPVRLPIFGGWSRAASALLLYCMAQGLAVAGPELKPDLVVAADGTADFKTIQEAVASIPATNHERTVVFIKDGVYHEKIRVDASFVTLRGQSRKGTRIEFPQLNDDFTAKPDALGRAVINVNHADDFVLENLTAENTAGEIGPHAFTVYGTGDKTVIVDCDVLSHGADTVSLWLGDRGRYYHANCNFSGSVDFVCPRGWCYITNCNFYERKNTAAVWHDGSKNRDMKFVLRDCRFDGVDGWNLARHHLDAQFYFLDCTFSATMTNKPIRRVIYPDDPQRNANLDKSNLWGERAYFSRCHRDGGDFDWFADNLVTAPASPNPAQIIPAWTFAGTWNPERRKGPAIQSVTADADAVRLTFGESVTVKGHPRLKFGGGNFSNYTAGSGTPTLTFGRPGENSTTPIAVELNGGAIVLSEAVMDTPSANLEFPPPKLP